MGADHQKLFKGVGPLLRALSQCQSVALVLLVLLVVGVLLASCERPAAVTEEAREEPIEASTIEFEQVVKDRLPVLIDDGELAGLEVALTRGRSWLVGRDQEWQLEIAGRVIRKAAMLELFDTVLAWLASDLSPESLAARIVYTFDIVELKSIADPTSMLVTGYYEPVIEASLRRTGIYKYPIRALPRDLIQVSLGDFSDRWKGQRTAGFLQGRRLMPYPDRREIRRGREPRGSQVLAWALDPVDLFFVEIQGSGSLRLPDGSERRIGYAGSNGRDYHSIGRLLIDEGKVPRERMSMQAIRSYLAANPDEIDRVLDHNTSVVFFRFLDSSPVGSLGIPVTPERSIATDHQVMPRGALGFLITDRPAMAADGTTEVEGPLTRFVMNHDTGGAIRGPKRVDFFWGKGPEAAERAGVMKQPGRLLFVLPRADPKLTPLIPFSPRKPQTTRPSD